VVEFQPSEGRLPFRAWQGGFGLIREGDGPRAMRSLRRLTLAALDELIATILADRFEEAVAGLRVGVVERDEGLVDELAEQAEDVA